MASCQLWLQNSVGWSYGLKHPRISVWNGFLDQSWLQAVSLERKRCLVKDTSDDPYTIMGHRTSLCKTINKTLALEGKGHLTQAAPNLCYQIPSTLGWSPNPSQQNEWGWRRVNGIRKSLRIFSQDIGSSSLLQKCSAQKSLSLSFAHEAVLDVGRKSEQDPK